MLTKDVLDEIIRRRYDEGKTLSIEHIDGERYSKWKIRDAARKYYGGWADARNEVVGVSKYGHKPDMSKEEVIAELRRLQAQGHSMNSGDFEPWFYRRIVGAFGGYMQAKKELGIIQNRKSGSGIKAREVSEILAELRKVYPEIKTKGDYRTKARRVYDYSQRHYGDAYKIFEIAGLEVPGSKKRERTPAYWTDEKIRKELKLSVEKCGSTSSNKLKGEGYRRLVGAVGRRYGTWNAGLVALGYEVAYEYRDPSDNLTKEETKEKVLNALARGIKPSRGALEKEIKGLARSIKNEFKGIGELKKYCGFCAIDDRPSEKETRARLYRPDLTTVEGIKREITRMWYIGAPMNYAYVSKKRKHVLDAVNKQIGSWRNAVESIGLNYGDVSATTNVLSECGTAFENLFAEILTELGYEYIREGEGVSDVGPEFVLKPDFILPNWRWIDCKLSEWTDIRETIIRYHSEKPNGITIVYLRGKNQRKERGQQRKYEHVSVYQFTKQLPKDMREYYEKELRKIEDKANENTVAK